MAKRPDDRGMSYADALDIHHDREAAALAAHRETYRDAVFAEAQGRRIQPAQAADVAEAMHKLGRTKEDFLRAVSVARQYATDTAAMDTARASEADEKRELELISATIEDYKAKIQQLSARRVHPGYALPMERSATVQRIDQARRQFPDLFA